MGALGGVGIKLGSYLGLGFGERESGESRCEWGHVREVEGYQKASVVSTVSWENFVRYVLGHN